MIRLVPFSDTTDAEKKMILSWRNHGNVRRWMLNTGEISMEEHLRFIQSLQERPDKSYFLVYEEQEALGVIDLCSITQHSATIGLYANPTAIRPGAGSILMKALIDFATDVLQLKTLKAEVYSDNQRAKHLYEKFDFKETQRMIHNNREMTCMERIK